MEPQWDVIVVGAGLAGLCAAASATQHGARVLVLESGRIVEDGAPQALLAGGSGHYAALHESWRESLA